MTKPLARCYVKDRGGFTCEVWVEVFEDGDWSVASESRVLMSANELLIDSLTVYPQYQRRGYGRMMVDKLKEMGLRVKPIGVLYSAEGFWDKVTPGWRPPNYRPKPEGWKPWP